MAIAQLLVDALLSYEQQRVCASLDFCATEVFKYISVQMLLLAYREGEHLSAADFLLEVRVKGSGIILTRLAS